MAGSDLHLDDVDLQTHRTLHEIVRAEGGDHAIHCIDAESVDAAGDYRGVLDALDRISGGAVRLRGCTATEGETRVVVVERHGLPDVTLHLSQENGWIDHPALVAQLDAVLEQEGATALFYSYWSRDFGQEVAFAYLPRATGERIAALVRRREEHEIFETFFPPCESDST